MERMKNLLNNERGATAVLFSICLTVFIGMAAFSNDVGLMLTAKGQLQSAVDASALAAASGLTVDQVTATQRGISISNSNTILQQPVIIQNSEIIYLDATTVQITVTRPANLYFSQLFGLNSAPITATATATIGNRDIMLIFDRSGSMDDDTVDPDVPQPITDTQNAAVYFVDQIENSNFALDRMGLVSYSTNASLNDPLTQNFGQIRNTIWGFEANGYTNIGAAIRIASRHLVQNQRTRTYMIEILLSDGMANRPGSGLPTNPRARNYALSKAQQAADQGIKIFTISLGTSTDWDLMEQIATMTGGIHFFAPTPADLDAIFETIAAWIPIVLIS